MKQIKCDHTTIRFVDVIVSEWNEYEECHVDDVRRREQSESLLEDIDTHRMKCSRCGKIEYYSKAAEDFFERGRPSDIVQHFNKKR